MCVWLGGGGRLGNAERERSKIKGGRESTMESTTVVKRTIYDYKNLCCRFWSISTISCSSLSCPCHSLGIRSGGFAAVASLSSGNPLVTVCLSSQRRCRLHRPFGGVIVNGVLFTCCIVARSVETPRSWWLSTNTENLRQLSIFMVLPFPFWNHVLLGSFGIFLSLSAAVYGTN